MLYGLLNYTYGKRKYDMGANFGDEIQSIAASCFLPKIDYFVDRERISENISSLSNEKIKLIMNGWFIHDQNQWPPAKNIIPLLISMHFVPEKNFFIKNLFSPKNIEYLLENGPVGTRDLETLYLLQKHDIPSYFSGCMTLTLPKNDKIQKQEYILCVDVKKEIVEALRKITKRKIYCISPVTKYPLLTSDEKFEYALSYLNAYQSAYAVITTRLHTAMPCLALETPVLLIDDSKGKDGRFSGLGKLLRKSTTEYYIKNLDMFNVNNIEDNTKDYLFYREKLIKSCEAFTGYKHQKFSPLFNYCSKEEENVKKLAILRNVSNRFSAKKILYKYKSPELIKELVNASIKRSCYKAKSMIKK